MSVEPWHLWFAWRPVPTPDGMAWWKIVERRRSWAYAHGFTTNYRLPGQPNEAKL